MRRRPLTLAQKMIAQVCAIVILVFAITAVIVSTRAARMAKADAMRTVTEAAARQAAEIAIDLGDAMTTARTLAQMLQAAVRQRQDVNRASVDRALVEMLKAKEFWLFS